MSLKHSILAILSMEPKTGYQISKDVQNSISFFWKATHQQIYRDLAGLEEKGWVKHREVSQEEKPDKKIYSLTNSGKKELLRWMKEPSEIPATRDSFMIKLFMGNLVDSLVLLEDLRDQKKIHQSRQKQFQEAKEKYFADVSSLTQDDHYKYLTLRRGILLGEAWLAWSQEVESFLDTSS
jgi:DNA-binding PadR family transcriptional regulator